MWTIKCQQIEEFIKQKYMESITNVNAIEFIHLNGLSWLVINLCLTFSLVLIDS
jgi:hypothetical protein